MNLFVVFDNLSFSQNILLLFNIYTFVLFYIFRQDPRLDSFINYLHRNGETKNMPLVELAVLEQFSIAGLELNQKNVISFSSAAKKILNDRRAKR